MKICGVYQILNNINSRCYIGQSLDIEGRLKDHFKALRKGCHNSPHLQSAFDKYGEQVFSTRILTRCCPEHLTQVEQGWMERFKHNRYNVCPAATSMLGYRHTDKTKKKMSVYRMGNKYSLGYKHTSETRAKVSAALIGNKHSLGRKMSEENKEKLLAALKGRKISVETKAKLSAASKGNKNCLGHKHTEETKIKIRAAWVKYKEEKLCNTK